MRILVLSNVPPGTVGGAEMQALRLALQWTSAGHKVTVAGYANQPYSKGNLSVIRIPTLRQNSKLRGLTYLTGVLLLLLSQRRQYDLIYCRFLKEQAFAASLAKIIFRLQQPLVACPACASIGGDANYISQKFTKRIWLKVFRTGISAINAMTREIEGEIQKLGLGDLHISRIPNGVKITAINTSQPIENPVLRMISVSRLTQQKGIDTLLDAIQLLTKTETSFKLFLVGDGHLRQKFMERIKSDNLDRFVDLLGQIQPSALMHQLANSDLFVLPSRYEGMSGAILEAMAQGLPIIATYVSGSEDMVDDTIGWLVPPDDADALATALLKALRAGKAQLRQMGMHARVKARKYYDITKIARRYESLFESLLRGSVSKER